MNKNKIIVIIALLVILLFSIIYIVFLRSTPPEMLTINFISDRPLTDENKALPGDIVEFCEVFEMNEGKETYYPDLYFERLDCTGKDHITFSETISRDTKVEKAKAIYTEAPGIISTSLMTQEKAGAPRGYEKDTTKMCYFFLLCSGDKRRDNIKYFDNVSTLELKIKELLAAGTLFRSDQLPNTINVIMLCGEGDSEDESVFEKTERKETDSDTSSGDRKENPTDEDGENPRQEEETKPKPLKLGSFSLNFNTGSSRNDFSWNLENAPEGTTYRLEINCDGKCQGGDYSYSKESSATSVSLDLTSEFDRIKYRTFKAKVTAYDAGGKELKSVSKGGLNLKCKS